MFYSKQTPLIKLNTHSSTAVLATKILQYNLLIYFNNTYSKNMKLSLYKCRLYCRE